MPCSHLPVRQFGVIGRLILATCQTSNRSSQVLKQTDYECINFTAVFQFASEIVISKSSSRCLNKCFKEASDWPLDVLFYQLLKSFHFSSTRLLQFKQVCKKSYKLILLLIVLCNELNISISDLGVLLVHPFPCRLQCCVNTHLNADQQMAKYLL